jgi:hypothetical protein
MDYFYLLLQQYALSLRIISQKIRKSDISCYNRERQIVCFDSIYPANSTVLRRIAMSYNYNFIYSVSEDKAELFDLHFYSSQTRKKEITHKCYR